MYADEKEFKGRYNTFLLRQGCFVQSIESHNTPGIPDLYVMSQKHGCVWVELKNDKKKTLEQAKSSMCNAINFRPGQIAWHYQLFQAHKFKQCVVTIVALQDGFMLAPSFSTNNVKLNNECLFVRDMPDMRLLCSVSKIPAVFGPDRRSLFVDYVQHLLGPDEDFDADVLWEELLPGMNIEDPLMDYATLWTMYIAVVRHWQQYRHV